MYTALPETHSDGIDGPEANSGIMDGLDSLMSQLRVCNTEEQGCSTPAVAASQAAGKEQGADTMDLGCTAAEWVAPAAFDSPHQPPAAADAPLPGSCFHSPSTTLCSQGAVAEEGTYLGLPGDGMHQQLQPAAAVPVVPGAMQWPQSPQAQLAPQSSTNSSYAGIDSSDASMHSTPKLNRRQAAKGSIQGTSPGCEEETFVGARSVRRITARRIMDSDSEVEASPPGAAAQGLASPVALHGSFVSAHASPASAGKAMGPLLVPSPAAHSTQPLATAPGFSGVRHMAAPLPEHSWQQQQQTAAQGSDSEQEGPVMARSVRKPSARRVIMSDSEEDEETTTAAAPRLGPTVTTPERAVLPIAAELTTGSAATAGHAFASISPLRAAQVPASATTALQSPWSCFKPIQRARKPAVQTPAQQPQPAHDAPQAPQLQLVQKPGASPLPRLKPSVHFQVPTLKQPVQPEASHRGARMPGLSDMPVQPPAAGPSAMQPGPRGQPQASGRTPGAADVIDLISDDGSEGGSSDEESSQDGSSSSSSSSWAGTGSEEEEEEEEQDSSDSGDGSELLQPPKTGTNRYGLLLQELP